MIVLLLLTAYIPPLVWLWFLYGRDRYEREPKRLIINLFLLGLGASVPVLAITNATQELFSPGFFSDVPGAETVVPVISLSGIVVLAFIALVTEGMKYAFASSRIRWDPNFSEPVDGMLYMASTGLGFAAAVGASTVITAFQAVVGTAVGAGDLAAISSEEFTAAIIAAAIAGILTTLGHASFSGIVGYFMSGHVLAGRRFGYVITGLLIATGLNAAYMVTLSQTAAAGSGVASLALPSVVVVAAVALFAFLFAKALRASPRRRESLTSAPAAATS